MNNFRNTTSQNLTDMPIKKKYVVFFLVTRMHSSRLRTARFNGHFYGCGGLSRCVCVCPGGVQRGVCVFKGVCVQEGCP